MQNNKRRETLKKEVISTLLLRSMGRGPRALRIGGNLQKLASLRIFVFLRQLRKKGVTAPLIFGGMSIEAEFENFHNLAS